MKKMISRRNFLTAAGVVAAAGVLTACGGSSSSTAASSTAASAAGSAAASGDTIKIGVMGPLTGNVSVYGQAVVNGASHRSGGRCYHHPHSGSCCRERRLQHAHGHCFRYR